MAYRRVSTQAYKAAIAVGKHEDLLLCKPGPCKVKRAVGTREQERRLTWTISDGSRDRHGDTVNPQGWRIDNFRRGGSVLWNHIHEMPPVAKPIDIWVEGDKLKSTAQFPSRSVNPFAHMIYQLARRGYIRASSVGFLPIVYEKEEDEGGDGGIFAPIRFIEQELLEWSPVSVPANPNALQDAQAKGIDLSPMRTYASQVLDGQQLPWGWLSRDAADAVWRLTTDPPARVFVDGERDEPDTDIDPDIEGDIDAGLNGVISWNDAHPDGTGLAEKDADWDGPSEIAEADVDDLLVMCAWVDPEAAETKAGYKLPHHTADGHETVWRGVVAAMSALLGARGEVDIPGADVPGVYEHLALHYNEFDEEPPELKAEADEAEADEAEADEAEADEAEADEAEAGCPSDDEDETLPASPPLRQILMLRLEGVGEMMRACGAAGIDLGDEEKRLITQLYRRIDVGEDKPEPQPQPQPQPQPTINRDDWQQLKQVISAAVRHGISRAAGRV